jgi:hypothetical protein
LAASGEFCEGRRQDQLGLKLPLNVWRERRGQAKRIHHYERMVQSSTTEKSYFYLPELVTGEAA